MTGTQQFLTWICLILTLGVVASAWADAWATKNKEKDDDDGA